MKILSLNSGSSSLKYMIFDYEKSKVLCSGIVERIKEKVSSMEYTTDTVDKTEECHCPTHKEAIDLILKAIVDPKEGVLGSLKEISAVGHRVLHGGAKFRASVLITDEVVQGFKDLYPLGPLHNPANVAGIEATRAALPDVPQMAIIDTAWHQTMPQYTHMYALPYEWYEKHHIQKYGFHGTSFLYVAHRTAVLLKKKLSDCNLVICHIGNGASVNAVKGGKSFDTSMGLTPLEGLVMGTRCGDIDPAVVPFIMKAENLSCDEISSIMNKKSGILGVTGKYTDRRDVEKATREGDPRASLVLEMESYRIRKYIGAYTAALGRVDAVVFTAGVGERSPLIRSKALSGLSCMGIDVDEKKNLLSNPRNAETCISKDSSPIKIFVVPTDEERVFIEDIVTLLQGRKVGESYTFDSPDYVNNQRVEGLKKDLQKFPGLENIIVK